MWRKMYTVYIHIYIYTQLLLFTSCYFPSQMWNNAWKFVLSPFLSLSTLLWPVKLLLQLDWSWLVSSVPSKIYITLQGTLKECLGKGSTGVFLLYQSGLLYVWDLQPSNCNYFQGIYCISIYFFMIFTCIIYLKPARWTIFLTHFVCFFIV